MAADMRLHAFHVSMPLPYPAAGSATAVNVQWILYFCDNLKISADLHRAIANPLQFSVKVFPSIVFVDRMIDFGTDISTTIKFYLKFAISKTKSDA